MTDTAPSQTPGARLRRALAEETPLQIPGAVNAYTALLAQRAGFRAVYLSGAGVANASFGRPDLGLTTLTQVCTDAGRICQATDLPLLVDADTGWDDPGEAVRQLAAAGAAGIHLEDQVAAKRCGHRDGKRLVDTGEMEARLRSAVAAKPDPDFVVMARTDAVTVEGVDAAVARAQQYVAQGADMIFAEACRSLDEFRAFTAALPVPVLANITEFGKTPLFTVRELSGAGVAMVLYPLSAFRAMSRAAERVFSVLRENGSQAALLDEMQTREQLYDILDYDRQERQQ